MSMPKTRKRVCASKDENIICQALQWRMAVPQITAAGFLANVGSALALTYDVEAPSLTPEDLQSAAESVVTAAPTSSATFTSLQDSPALIAGGVAFLLVGIALAVASSKDKPVVRGTTPEAVLGILAEDPNTVFVDIRSKASVKKSGNPSLVGIKGKSRVLPFTEEKGDEVKILSSFGEKFARISGLRDESVVVLFDSDGTYSPKAAEEILKVLEFKRVLFVTGGETMWRRAELGWKEPPKPIKIPAVTVPKLSLPDIDLGGAVKGVSGAVKGVSGAVQGVTGAVQGAAGSVGSSSGALGPGLLLGAVAATSFIIVNEIDLILEVVGLFGAVNIIARKLLFADSRSEVVDRIRSLINDEIAPQEAGNDLKRLATAVMSFPRGSTTDVSREKVSTKAAE